MKITKNDLIEKLSKLSDDTQIFLVEGTYDVLDIKVFTESKDEDFLEWYFGI